MATAHIESKLEEMKENMANEVRAKDKKLQDEIASL